MTKKYSQKRNCPLCRASGLHMGDLCELCRGTRKIIIRYDFPAELSAKMAEKEFVDGIFQALEQAEEEANEAGRL